MISTYRPSCAEGSLLELGANTVNSSSITKVKREVSEKFTEMRGVQPSVKKHGAKNASNQQYLLTFKGKAELPGGRTISRVVRVVADERGHVLKMSTSK